MITNLEDLKIYQIAMEIGEEVWEVVSKWDYFKKSTIGNQWIRAADSIASNISEGYGRYSFKENKLFCYYARGSLFETKTWLIKSHNRSLISTNFFKTMENKLKILEIKLNNYIKSIGKGSQK
ncbi:MAG: four helix bundle protein [Candidatus Cloacimonadota bacterium]|nr:four helix bundle protein [Candidatus Cloacimonadota bacterium]